MIRSSGDLHPTGKSKSQRRGDQALRGSGPFPRRGHSVGSNTWLRQSGHTPAWTGMRPTSSPRSSPEQPDNPVQSNLPGRSRRPGRFEVAEVAERIPQPHPRTAVLHGHCCGMFRGTAAANVRCVPAGRSRNPRRRVTAPVSGRGSEPRSGSKGRSRTGRTRATPAARRRRRSWPPNGRPRPVPSPAWRWTAPPP